MSTQGYVTKLFLRKELKMKRIPQTTEPCQSAMDYAVERRGPHGGNRRHDPFPSSNEPCGQKK